MAERDVEEQGGCFWCFGRRGGRERERGCYEWYGGDEGGCGAVAQVEKRRDVSGGVAEGYDAVVAEKAEDIQ